jgi:hypothetical protein
VAANSMPLYNQAEDGGAEVAFRRVFLTLEQWRSAMKVKDAMHKGANWDGADIAARINFANSVTGVSGLTQSNAFVIRSMPGPPLLIKRGCTSSH